MHYSYLPSPIGRLMVAGDEEGLKWVVFEKGKYPPTLDESWEEKQTSLLRETKRQLKAYFAGKLQDFDVDVAPEGTEFQRKVWRRLQDIPYGETISYGTLARRVGNPKASRAVGAANGKNPVSIVVPCHRVIGSTGNLTGFGGGLRLKERLLALESNEQLLFA